ncbi:MAG: O-antigen ligase family protein [Bacillota bacterium]
MINEEGFPAGRFPMAQRLIFLMLLFLVAIPPFFRGLFFYEDMWNYLTLAVPAFILTMISRSGQREIKFDALDYLMLAFPLAYAISSIRPVDFYFSVNETIRYFTFFFFYYMVSRLVTGGRRTDALIAALYVSGLVVAAACIPFALGVFSFTGGFTGLFTSFFQYKNTLAAFLGAVLFLGLYLWKNRGGEYGWIITIANFTIMFGMRGASSRGGVLAFCAALLLMGLLNYRKRDLSLHLYLLMLTLLTQFSVPMFIGLVNLGHGAWSLPVFLTTVAVAALSDRVMTARGVYMAGPGKRAAYVVLTLLLVILLMSGTVFDSTYFTGSIERPPAEIQTGGGTDPVNFWYRLYYDLDALEMAAERPLSGWGGGGWQSAYRYYQDFLYNTKRIHNHFLEVLVESGLPGLIIFTGLWAVFAIRSVRLYRNNLPDSRESNLYLFVFLAAITLGIHALMDFTLSFLSVLLFIAALFGFIRAVSGGQQEGGSGIGLMLRGGLVIFSVMILAVSWVQLEAHQRFTAAENLAEEKGSAGAGGMFEDALRLNGWNSNYQLKYAQHLRRGGDIEGAYRHAVRAAELNPYLGLAYFHASRYASDLGRLSQAVYLGRQAVKVSPFQLMWYGNLSKAYYNQGAHYLSEDNTVEAVKYFKLAAGVVGGVQGLIDSIPGKKKSMWIPPPSLEVPPEAYLYSGAGAYLAGDRAGGEGMILEAAAHNDTGLEANLWLAVISSGDEPLRDIYLNRALEMDREAIPRYNYLVSLAEKAHSK